MLFLKRFICLAVPSLVLAGCMTAQPANLSAQVQPPLSDQQRQMYYIADVGVSVHPNAQIAWSEGQAAVASEAGVGFLNSGSYVASEAGKKAYHAYIADRVEREIEPPLKSFLSGERKAFASVQIASMSVTSTGQQSVFGGSGTGVGGGIQIYDLETGERLTNPQIMSGGFDGSGVPGLIGAAVDAAQGDQLSLALAEFSSNVRTWITAEGPVLLPFPNAATAKVPELPRPTDS